MRRALAALSLVAGSTGSAAAGEPAADVSISLRVRSDVVAVGSDGLVVARIRNDGPDAATDVIVTLTLPAALVPATPRPSSGSCSAPIECELGAIPADAMARVRLVVTPTSPGTHDVVAQIASSTADPDPADDAAGAAARASGPACDVVGTQGPDRTRVGPGDLVACGLRGDDRIAGDAGPEVLLGGSGDDVMLGGRGDDELRGGVGADAASFRGAPAVRVALDDRRARGEGNDVLRSIERVIGSRGDDVLEGSRRRDELRGLGGADVIAGGAGPDRLVGGEGADSLAGDRGNDRLAGGPAVDGCIQGLGSRRKRSCEVLGFALARGLALFEPGRAVVGYGFHESLFRTAIPMRPLGRVAGNDHPRFSPPSRTDGPRYVVMGSRGRPTGPTTSVDVVVASRARVRSPVTGTVVSVERYRLYCEDLDWKVVLRPLGAPDTRVLVLHMATPRVAPGDDVTVGSPLGTARANDAASAQANRYFPDAYPHVHVEVERDGASPTPGCPA